MKPIIVITAGDFNGIGPELAIGAALHPSVKKICTPVLIGPYGIFQHTAKILKRKVPLALTGAIQIPSRGLPVFDTGDGIAADIQYGKVTKTAGRSAGAALEQAVDFCLRGSAAAMVTAPVSKEALNLAGYQFPGQTEMIALLSRSKRVAMMLVSKSMRVGLVTIHCALKDVAASISREKVFEKISIIHTALKEDYRIQKPRIAILALNPHAGEGGLLGTEESEHILPAISDARASGIHAEGPFPADAFFGCKAYMKYDALAAMYHDQGLIPLKMNSFESGVNVTAGLKIIRTSPDHGTAFDIAGKNKANLTSMLEAIRLAVHISKNRHIHD